MLVNARHLIRKMRGGAQAHLLACDDGRFYVVKFRNNPQHRRILVNEWIASVFLRYLEISSPDTAIVNLSEEFLAANPDVCLQLGSKTIRPELGWHFGSCYPGDPGRVSVYDFIPDILLQKIENLPHFLAVLAFDKWMGNADSRQTIFFRARVRQFLPVSRSAPEKTGFVASMMDHGYVFDGPHWAFTESPLQGLYFRPIVYRKARGFEDFEPWLDRIVHFPEEVVDDALKQLPPQWLNGDRMVLETILTKLMSRRRRVPDLIQDSAKGRVNLFPNWK